LALTSAQIVNQAITMAKATGNTTLAGQLLNMVLQELCQSYDFSVAQGTYNFTLSPGTTSTVAYPNNTPGSGPYALPADFLRCDKDDFIWFLQGVPYPLIHVDLSEYDWMVQTAGFQSYPYLVATDLSLYVSSTPVFIVWPPASGNFTGICRYQRQMPDITTPETSSTIPWFPDQLYLITRLAGELMKLTNDERWSRFLGDSPEGANAMLRKYLMMKDDSSDRAKTVTLDRRRFGTKFSGLSNTKTVGW
jgi:hypothetical protein